MTTTTIKGYQMSDYEALAHWETISEELEAGRYNRHTRRFEFDSDVEEPMSPVWEETYLNALHWEHYSISELEQKVTEELVERPSGFRQRVNLLLDQLEFQRARA